MANEVQQVHQVHEAREVHTHKQCQVCQETFHTNDLLQHHLESYRSEEQYLLARLNACRAHTIVLNQIDEDERNESDDFIRNECNVGHGTKSNTAGLSSRKVCPIQDCPHVCGVTADLQRHYYTHIAVELNCAFCYKRFDRLSTFIRHNGICRRQHQVDEAKRQRATVLIDGLKAEAKDQLERLRECQRPAAGKVKVQPRKRSLEAVNSSSDTPQPSKKARVASDLSAEAFTLNLGLEAASMGSDMQQPSKKAEEPSQRTQVDSGELGEAFISNPEQEGTMANALSFHHLNVEEAGSPVSESLPLEPISGSYPDHSAPIRFHIPAPILDPHLPLIISGQAFFPNQSNCLTYPYDMSASFDLDQLAPDPNQGY
ncbi:hypothetical protein F5883DRAFT_241506 [Diaporthe sp. PMI_573]|nr:hypothetical protein F5883DRAFT_241506 [Diaporthaceae sp. PMI_573]